MQVTGPLEGRDVVQRQRGDWAVRRKGHGTKVKGDWAVRRKGRG